MALKIALDMQKIDLIARHFGHPFDQNNVSQDNRYRPDNPSDVIEMVYAWIEVAHKNSEFWQESDVEQNIGHILNVLNFGPWAETSPDPRYWVNLVNKTKGEVFEILGENYRKSLNPYM